MASGTDGSRSSDSEIRTLSSALGPFLLCLLHSYQAFSICWSTADTTPYPITSQQKENTSFPVFLVNIPELTFTGLPWVTLPISEPITGARHGLCWGPGRPESLVYSQSLRVGVSPTSITESRGGEIPPRKPGMQFPEEGGRVARLTELQTSTTVIW